MKVLLAPGGMWPEPAGVPLAGSGHGLAPSRVAACLASGWSQARPHDALSLLPMADGGPGSAQVIGPHQVASREVIQGRGPLGQVREVDLVRLVPRPSRSGNQDRGEASTWFLDAARLLALPTDPGEAAQEALEGSTSGLGGVIGAALSRTGPLDTLLVGMSRSAVHDGGLGTMDALGGLRAAKDLLSRRSLGLVLADDIALGGMNGAGAALAGVTTISPERAQELDRRACARAMEVVSAAQDLDPGAVGPRRPLPVITALNDVGLSASAHTADSAGTARLSTSTWGTGAGGGSALVLRALGAGARPGARVMAEILGLSDAVCAQDLVVTAWGELYDVLSDGVVGVVGQQTASQALPCIVVCGRCAVSRAELAAAGVTNAYGLQEVHATESWEASGSPWLESRLTDLGSRLSRTWSR
ncbi:glycerate kinase [Actinomyces oris]|uniref:Glycerate kinase n=1 Tax=Actinomyces oris TaxID=544580 RepID=A0A1Q8VIX2_9ACTO|nr:glycerate kinase [Actinomyces oris]OLO48037.1 glycerate kinase [Actinomyces oris]